MRAPPPGFSQLTASFLACSCLGIHRAPFVRLTGSVLLPYPRSGPALESCYTRRYSLTSLTHTQPSLHFTFCYYYCPLSIPKLSKDNPGCVW
jgi:hypothetical protein